MSTTGFDPKSRKVIFIGLDCATYWITQKLIANGRMPNLAALMRRGVTFRSETEEPVVSPVVWTSIASAKVPDKHGVKSFNATSKSVRCKRIWDIFLEQGSRVGVIGHFVTWPPKPVDGFMIPDLLALDDQTYPPEFRFLHNLTESNKVGRRLSYAELLRYAMQARKYGARASTLWGGVREVVKSKFSNRPLIESQFDVRVLKQRLYGDIFVGLCKIFRPRYAYFHNHLIDTSSHIFWKYLEPTKFGDVVEADVKRYGDKLFQAYEHADETLGRIMSLADQDTLIVLASDHGAKAAVEEAKQWRIPTIKAEVLMQTLGIEKDVSYSNVGFDILVKPRMENEAVKGKLEELFSAIRIKEDDLPLFQILNMDSTNIWLRLNNAIDEFKDRHIAIKDTVRRLDDFVHASNDRTSGVHDGKNAILVLSGRGVKPNRNVEKIAQVLDITPTILALSGLPVARDMDGDVLHEALDEDFLKAHPIEYIDSYDEEVTQQPVEDVETSEELKERLRALGYL